MNDNRKFTFRYSAPTQDERREIEDIRRRYGGDAEEKDKLTRLRELDKRVKNPPAILGYCLGIAGILIFGAGLAIVLERDLFVQGVLVMLAGCVPMALAYPARKIFFAKNKKKYAGEIMRLSGELLNETSSESRDGENRVSAEKNNSP